MILSYFSTLTYVIVFLTSSIAGSHSTLPNHIVIVISCYSLANNEKTVIISYHEKHTISIIIIDTIV
jgi:hypothetical protein